MSNIFNFPVIFVKLVLCYCYDMWRFLKAACLFREPMECQKNAKAHLLRISHSLEKGMSLPVPRKEFGRAKCESLKIDLRNYQSKYGHDDITSIVEEIIKSYEGFGRGEIFERNGLGDLRASSSGVEGGTVALNKASLARTLPVVPEDFFKGRRSVRQFANEAVSVDEIRRAVKMAQESPSVCNRQSSKIYAFQGDEKIKEVLSFQDGNTGFGETGSVVFIITSDMRCFYKNGERNQGFVDGALFAMSLVYSLHCLQIGSCFLNWSMGAGKDYKMRRALGIPSSEVVVSFLVAGRLREDFDVAVSPRRLLSEVLIIA